MKCQTLVKPIGQKKTCPELNRAHLEVHGYVALYVDPRYEHDNQISRTKHVHNLVPQVFVGYKYPGPSSRKSKDGLGCCRAKI